MLRDIFFTTNISGIQHNNKSIIEQGGKQSMKNYDKDPTELLTCDEAVQYLRCGYNTLYRLLKDGELHAYKEGRIWKIPVGGIDSYIKKRANLK